MNRRTWVMVAALPASLLLALVAMSAGSTLALAAVAVCAVALVLGLIVVDSRASIRDTEAFNRLAAEYGGLSKDDLRRMRDGLEPVRKGQPATGPAVATAAAPAPEPEPVEVLACESCARRPATTVVAVDGQRFAVCEGCVPVPAFRDAGESLVGLLVLVAVAVGGVVGLAWAVHRVGDLVIPLKLLMTVLSALLLVGVIALAVTLLGAAVGGAVYALEKHCDRRALARVTVQSVTSERPAPAAGEALAAMDVHGPVVAGEVISEGTR